MADLGALGATSGPEIAYQWSPPSHLPRFLPALALLLLLFLKRNRSFQALWVAAPLAGSLTIVSLLSAVPGLGSAAPDGLFGILGAVLFGLTATWLLSPYVKRRGRFLTCLGMLATLESYSLLACAVGQSSDAETGLGYRLIAVAVLGLVLSLAINLAGWSCRRRYDRRRLALWLILWIMAGWLGLFVMMSMIEKPGPLLEMATAFAIFCAVSFSLLLPFLLLSSTNPFYRERLNELLLLADLAPPSAPQPPASSSGSGGAQAEPATQRDAVL